MEAVLLREVELEELLTAAVVVVEGVPEQTDVCQETRRDAQAVGLVGSRVSREEVVQSLENVRAEEVVRRQDVLRMVRPLL